jgi:hypothetical protein
MEKQNYSQTLDDLDVIRRGYIDMLAKQIRGDKPVTAFDLKLKKAGVQEPVAFGVDADKLAFQRKIIPQNQSDSKQMIYGD